MSPAQYRKERTRRGLSQAALAALLGVPREAVNRREAGTQQITKEAALALFSLPKIVTPRQKPAKYVLTSAGTTVTVRARSE